MSTTQTIDTALVSTTPQAAVGQLYTKYNGTAGPQVWIYVKAGGALAVGTVASRHDATTTYADVRACATSSSPWRVVGVAQHAIASGSYGWILREGVGFVLADATGYAVDVLLIPDASTAGCAAAAVSSILDAGFGFSVLAQSGAGATGKAVLFCHG